MYGLRGSGRGSVLSGKAAAPIWDDKVERALDRLRASESARREAITELIDLGVIRSRGLVADYGETLAARYYGVKELELPSTPGYDLTTHDGRKVQVRTLRTTPENFRRSMGTMKEPYDTLLAVRIDQDFRVLYAIEIPRTVLEDHYEHGSRTALTRKLEREDRVTRIEAEELLTEGAGMKP